MRNHGQLLTKITAAGLMPLLLLAGVPPTAAAGSCKDWKTAKFFETATVDEVRACLSAGRDPNEVDRQGLTALHRAARETSDPAVIEALLDAGANPRLSSRAGRLPRYYARKNDKIKGSAAYQRLRIASAKKPKKADWSRVRAVPHHRKTKVLLYQDEARAGELEDQGPLRLGHGRVHHARAQGRANAHRPKAGRAQGSHPPPLRQTMARMGRRGGYILIRGSSIRRGHRQERAYGHPSDRCQFILRLGDERDLHRAARSTTAAASRQAVRRPGQRFRKAGRTASGLSEPRGAPWGVSSCG